MLSLQNKAVVAASLSIMADALLRAVNAQSDHASDLNCEAVERFIRHLDDSGDMLAAVLSLGADIESMAKLPESGIGRSPSFALVYLLMLAMGNPGITRHMGIPSRSGMEH